MNSSIKTQTGFAHLTDLPCISLQYGNATAVVSLYGAQVLSYQATTGQDTLWLSPLAQWHNQTPIRGGVPVCWPWFGPADNKVNPNLASLPNHGVVRTAMWQLKSQHADDKAACVVLETTVDNLPHYQGRITLQLQVSLTNTLSINLRCDTPLLQQAALHSYFATSSLANTQVQPLPAQYADKVSATVVAASSDRAEFNAEVDRVYSATAGELTILNGTKEVKLTQSGHDASVVWNPWLKRSKQIGDLADDSYLQFICVETARLQLNTAAALDMTQQINALC